jgi:hypothetical protein
MIGCCQTRASACEHTLNDLETAVPRAQGQVTDETTCEEIEEIAGDTRKRWGIPPGPIDDMVLQLERHGIVTTRFNVGNQKGAALLRVAIGWV